MLSVEEAEAELTAYAETVAGRDDMVRRAIAAGITKHRIHTLTGIARTTLDRIPLEAAMPAVRIVDVEEPGDLYVASGGGDQPTIHQTWIKLDLEDCVLRATVDGAADQPVLTDEGKGLTRVWAIPLLTADAANRVMREIAPAAGRITREWSIRRHYPGGGDSFNLVVELSSDGYAAEAEIDKHLSRTAFPENDLVEVRNVDEIDYFDEWGLNGSSTDAELDDIEQQIHADLNNPGRVTVWYHLRERLEDLRDELAERER